MSTEADKFPYEDIVNTPWPPVSEPGFREHMPLDDRAKIFAPFAALKGFNEAIEKRAADASRNDEEHHESWL